MEGCTLSSQKSDFDIFRVNLITDATAIPLGWLRYASDDAWAEDARDLLTELAVYLPEQPISSCSVIVSILASQHSGVWYKDVEEVDESGNFGWYTLNDLQGALPFKVAAWYYVGNSTAEDANP